VTVVRPRVCGCWQRSPWWLIHQYASNFFATTSFTNRLDLGDIGPPPALSQTLANPFQVFSE
jgi:hypothetical protein